MRDSKLESLLEAHPVSVVLRQHGHDASRSRLPCPFCYHEQRTPSPTFVHRGYRWHCFRCQRHGDTLNLVCELEGLDFKGAVRYLGAEGFFQVRSLEERWEELFGPAPGERNQPITRGALECAHRARVEERLRDRDHEIAMIRARARARLLTDEEADREVLAATHFAEEWFQAEDQRFQAAAFAANHPEGGRGWNASPTSATVRGT